MFFRDRRYPRTAIAWALAVALVAQRSADGAEGVDPLLKRGMELRRKGQDAEALAEFQRAVRLEDSGRTWAQVALAEQALGLWIDANAHLEQALEHAQEPWVRKNRAALDGAQRTIQSHLCQLEVWGGPAGATVLVDGKKIGTLPRATAWFDAGSAPLEIRAPGFVSAVKTLKLLEGARIREHADLKRAAAAAVGAAPSGPAPATVNLSLPAPILTSPARLTKRQADIKTSVQDDAPSQNPPDDDTPVYRRWWFWTIVGGVALAAAGTTAWMLTRPHDECRGLSPCDTLGQ